MTLSTSSTALEQLPALGVRLHDGVLDAVVDHLREVPGADLAGVHPAELALGLERVEDRLDELDVLLVAAGHQRVAVLQAPDAAGDAAVDEADALVREELGVGLVVGPARVAAVDDDVALRQQPLERLHGLPGRLARRDHHPDRPRGGQCLDHRLEAVHVAERRGCGRSRPRCALRGGSARACCRPSCRGRSDRGPCPLLSYREWAPSPTTPLLSSRKADVAASAGSGSPRPRRRRGWWRPTSRRASRPG